MKASYSFFIGVLMIIGHAVCWGESGDRVIFYDMKEDPTIAQLIANTSIKGFYGLEIDEDKGAAAVLYRVGDILYRADLDLKVKGPQLILRNGKRQKILIREQTILPSGTTQEIVYPVECPPSKAGWRRGPSFGKHMIPRDDEMGQRLLVGSLYVEYQIALKRCAASPDECGSIGCLELGGVESSTATVRISTGPVPLSQVLLDTKLGSQEILSRYKSDVNNILPSKLVDLSVMTTSYRTTPLPYPDMPDPLIAQRGLKIGVVGKSYSSDAKPEPVFVEVQPLMAEFQDPSPTKCGSWETNPNVTLFNLRGRPALYRQTPATGNAPAYSGIVVCGRTIALEVHAEGYRTKDELTPYFDVLAIEQMEHVVGGSR